MVSTMYVLSSLDLGLASCCVSILVTDVLATSKEDQEQYWSVLDHPYRYIPAGKFADAFSLNREGKHLSEELHIPFDKRHNHGGWMLGGGLMRFLRQFLLYFFLHQMSIGNICLCN
ncbi:hypothetical protein RIF29_15459 [Crotalaria pallida]|uniref:Uncharacterized protein n=1 Tax=Crotalaria pallida TaxID=3830 RepID=A0AAN9IDL2_CROPI